MTNQQHPSAPAQAGDNQMSNPNWITASIDDEIRECPPYDYEIDEAMLPEIAYEISRRFDYYAVYKQIRE